MNGCRGLVSLALCLLCGCRDDSPFEYSLTLGANTSDPFELRVNGVVTTLQTLEYEFDDYEAAKVSPQLIEVYQGTDLKGSLVRTPGDCEQECIAHGTEVNDIDRELATVVVWSDLSVRWTYSSCGDGVQMCLNIVD